MGLQAVLKAAFAKQFTDLIAQPLDQAVGVEAEAVAGSSCTDRSR